MDFRRPIAASGIAMLVVVLTAAVVSAEYMLVGDLDRDEPDRSVYPYASLPEGNEPSAESTPSRSLDAASGPGRVARRVEGADRVRDAASQREIRRESATVVRLLQREARSGEASQRLLTGEPDFASRSPVTDLPASEIWRLLGRPIGRDRAVDAYIKWQLLSFIDADDEADRAMLLRAMRAAPKLVEAPQPRLSGAPPRPGGGGGGIGFSASSTQAIITGFEFVPGTQLAVPQVGTVTSGASVGQKSGGASEADIERGLEDANRKLADAQARVEQINQPVIAYRDELAERLPQAQGARLAFMISDASDRVAAGSRSARAMGFAIRRETMNLVAAGDGVRRIREFALGIRRLAAQKQAVVRRVDIRGGRWAVSGDEVRVDRDALGEAYGMLEAAAKVDGAR